MATRQELQASIDALVQAVVALESAAAVGADYTTELTAIADAANRIQAVSNQISG